jgi:hypothetical protein
MARTVARFTAADEAVITSISARLRAQAFVIERDASADPDCYWICRKRSINPTWVLLRTEDGLYQLRDDLLCIERQGESLLEILPAAWISGVEMPARGAVIEFRTGSVDRMPDSLEQAMTGSGAHH